MENINCSTVFPSTRYWGTNRPDRPSLSIFWCPPPLDWIKINVDGVVFPNNCAGIGVVVRNHRGDVQLVVGSGFLHWDPGQVELAALRSLRRLLSPDMLAAKCVIIEGDCKNVLEFCRTSMHRATWSDANFMAEDLSFLAELNQVMFRHIPREANRLADFCAKFGSTNDFV
ncbi:hypothetical protein KSP39_PZI003970 [Platanthera zijinensis]|uniref:RNase H type-1 domain-containing protein n=1 Tax=Platanthera zijinensis TaxID=2320716 RepID=A0AAP0BWR5_9ASPA